MNYYQLDDEQMDQAFLEGEEVLCRIAIPKSGILFLNPGDPIVVALSNGSKYKGIVLTITPVWLKKIAFGEMTLRRAT